MRVAIIDADLIGRKRHRFPNLACMKLSGYHKGLRHEVVLKINYSELDTFDRVYISKVFTDTPVPCYALELSNVSFGSTGFFYDKAEALPTIVDHHMPDAGLIEEKIHLARKYTNAVMKFYCFCGFDRNNKWDSDFWKQNIFDFLIRIEILMRNHCLPYVMRFAKYEESPYSGVYISIARWCNQPSFYKKKSLREFSKLNGTGSTCYKYLEAFEAKFPEVSHFYGMKYSNTNTT